jgi:DNA-binding transcriptional regulator YiaG
MNLPKQLKAWRGVSKTKPRGEFSQAEASAKLGVSIRTYQEWEQGRMTPRGIALQALLERIE